MTALAWMFLAISQANLVIGQIFLKKAVTEEGSSGGLRLRKSRWFFSAGIACSLVWIQLWLGLLHRMPLSQLMPLEGVSPLVVTGCGVFFLGEQISWRAWIGILLTCAGVILVSIS